MNTNGLLANNSHTIKCIVLFILLILSIVAPATCHNIFRRPKRGTITIGDLPQIKPPVSAKKGEPKFPSPGWTHCIKYLTADVRWKSIKSVNLKKLQATQFQCSWYISSEVPGTQVRISFEKLDFGGQPTSTCTQQFLEIIDIKASKSQGRICGEKSKKISDYVSAGQRVRIDIQGEEPLVEKIRGNKEPFIISYKLVREPPGFRIGQPKKKELTNKVKQTVSSRLPNNNHERIYGSNNQPDLDNSHPDDPNPSGRASLAIWQVIIIIFVSLAIISCIIGVTVKRMVFDKKKKEEYLSFQAIQNEIKYSASENKKALPGLTTKVSHVYEKKYPPQEDKKKHRKLSEKQEAIPRSSSKPEGSVKKTQKIKRHNSHGDLSSKQKPTKHHKNLSDSKRPLLDGARVPGVGNGAAKHHTIAATVPSLVDDTPPSRATRKPGSKDGDRKQHPSSPTKKSHHTSNGVKKQTSNGATKSRKPDTDENKNHVKRHRSHKTKTNLTKEGKEKSRSRHRKTDHKERNTDSKEAKKPSEEDDTPPSRAVAKRPRHKKHTNGPNFTKPNPNKEKSSTKKVEHENRHSHKTTEKSQGKEEKKRKPTVSSAHKKATTSHGKKHTSSQKNSSHRTKKHHHGIKENSKPKNKTNSD